ncbi:MAG TPA: glycosyltransferase [Candidatus Angelobacter sp.]
MKKVCLFDFPRMEDFHGYSLDCLDPMPYLARRDSWMGRSRMGHQLDQADVIDRMYREKDTRYMHFIRDFIDKFRDADLVVLATYNPVHPEVLQNDLPKPIKVLGFVDDPISTYVRGIAYLWAFDGAAYISPSYNNQLLFKDALERWGCRQSRWWPLLSPRNRPVNPGGYWPLSAARAQGLARGDTFFRDRDLDLIYVGSQQGPKVNRLIQLRKRFGSRFKIYGRWPMAGYGGAARWFKGKPGLWTRVRPISDEERTSFYYRTKIGINMHLSDTPMETGNMRMYEVPAHGMMLLCDKAGMNAHEQIFVPGKEAVFYDSIEDAIEKIEYYLHYDEERIRIARAGFSRVHRDYDAESNLKNFLDWAIRLEKKSASTDGEAMGCLKGK